MLLGMGFSLRLRKHACGRRKRVQRL